MKKLFVLLVSSILCIQVSAQSGWVKKLSFTPFDELSSAHVTNYNDSVLLITGEQPGHWFSAKFDTAQQSIIGNSYASSNMGFQTKYTLISKFPNRVWGVAKFGFGYFIYKTDGSGNLLQANSIASNGSSTDEAQLLELNNGDIIVAGANVVIRMDSLGNQKWQRNFADDFNFQGLVYLSEAKFLIAGGKYNGLHFGSDLDHMLLCMDTSGILLWNKMFGTDRKEGVGPMVVANNHIYMTGYDSPDYTKSTPFIACYDTSGALLWNRYYSTGSLSYFKDMVLLADNTLMLWGQSSYNVEQFYTMDLLGEMIGSYTIADTMMEVRGKMSASTDSSFFLSCYMDTQDYDGLIKSDHHDMPGCVATLPAAITDYSMDWTSEEYPSIPYTGGILWIYGVSGVADTCLITNVCQSSCIVNASLEADIMHPCKSIPITIHDKSSNATIYNWRVDGVTVSTTSSDLVYAFNTSGVHLLELIASNGSCSDTAQIKFTVLNPPVAAFHDAVSGMELTVVADSSNASINQWSFGDGGFIAAHDTAIHNYTLPGTYQVCMDASNTCGQVSSCRNIYIGTTASNSFEVHYNASPSIGGLQFQRLLQKPDGGFYCLGGMEYGDIIETDINGNMERGTYMILGPPGTGTQYIEHAFLSKNGSICFAAYSDNASGNRQNIFGKWSRSNEVWANKFFVNNLTDHTGGIIELESGNFYFAGTKNNTAVLTLLDKAGQTLWTKQYLATNTIIGISLMPDTGLVVLANHTLNTGIVLFRTDKNGNVIWSKDYISSFSTSNNLKKLYTTKDGGFIIAGSTGNKAMLLKTDSAGSVLWSRLYDNLTTVNSIPSVTEALDGSLYFIGDYENGFSGNAKYISHADATGNLLQTWKTEGQFRDIISTLDTAVALIGKESNRQLLKLDRNATIPCGLTAVSIQQYTNIYTAANYITMTDPNTPQIALTGIGTYGSIPITDSLYCFSNATTLNAAFTFANGCVNAPISFTNQSVGAIASYLWTFNGAQVTQSTAKNPSATWTTAGTYGINLTVTDSNGLQSAYVANVIVESYPVIAVADKGVCNGSSVSISCSGTGFQTVNWSPATALNTTTGATVISTPAQDITYTVIATSPFGCADTEQVSVTVYQISQVTANIPDTVCSTAQVSFTAFGSLFYSWWANNTQIGSGNAVGPFTFGSSTLITVIGTDVHGCKDTVNEMMTQVPSPDPNITPAGSVYICSDDSVALNAMPGYSYQWYRYGDTLVNETQQTFYANQNGSYRCFLTSANSCTQMSFPVRVRVVCVHDNDDNQVRYFTDDENSFTAAVYPNPSAGDFTLETDCMDAKLTITDLKGRLVNPVYLKGGNNFIISGLETGIYIANVICGDQEFHLKMIKIN